MRLSLRFAGSALVAGLIGLSPAAAQDKPKPEAELKKAQEQLEKLVQQLRDQESKKREDGRKAVPDAPKPPTPARPMVWAIPSHDRDASSALKELLRSSDPKVAGLARELLGLLEKKRAGEGQQLQFEVVPAGSKPGKPTELKAGGLEMKHGGQIELKFGKPTGDVKGIEKRIVVVTEGSSASAGATSSLKLSADGKTAAVVSSDGTVTIYDVATGKETMKFAGKK